MILLVMQNTPLWTLCKMDQEKIRQSLFVGNFELREKNLTLFLCGCALPVLNSSFWNSVCMWTEEVVTPNLCVIVVWTLIPKLKDESTMGTTLF